MNKTQKAILLILLTAAPAARASNVITYDWTETGSTFGNGSGTLTMSGVDYGSDLYPPAYYDYAVTAMTGTLDGTTITGLNTPVTSSLDHLVFSTSSSPTPAGFFGAVLHFDAGGVEFGISGYNEGSDYTMTEAGTGSDTGGDLFSITAVPTPEPATTALAGLAGLAFAIRRWRATRA